MLNTSVMSATFEPNSVPRPNDDIPANDEFTATEVSGSIDITATTIKPIAYFDKPNPSASLAEYLVANVAPLITNASEQPKMNKLSHID